jgi:hypothetical protein
LAEWGFRRDCFELETVREPMMRELMMRESAELTMREMLRVITLRARRNLVPLRRSLVLAMLFLLGAACSASAQQQPADEEYRVYEAVLKLIGSIPTADPHVVIYDRTLNGKCDAASNNPVLANGCTFLWVKPDTEDDVERLLRSRWRGLERSTWKHFKLSNAESITLHDPISTPWKHRLAGAGAAGDDPEEWKSPDMSVFFSRVGFNNKKTEAIVYVLAFSYVGRMATTGDYLRFRCGPDKVWTLAGRVRYLAEDDDQFASLPSKIHASPTLPQLRSIAELK